MILSKLLITKKAFLFIICFCIFTLSYAQQTDEGFTITGKITDIKNNPVSGANVFVTNYASSFSNDSGIFTIKVPSNKISLQISSKGFDYIEVPLKGRNEISVVLIASGSKFKFEDIDLPLGSLPQSNTVYATDYIKNNDAITSSVESPENFIQGKLAGINTFMRSGVPGSGANMFVRGFNSFMLNNQPLIVVDGTIYENVNFGESQINNSFQNLLSLIDVRDIQSITLIKDAAAIYGSKAANGVIVITTKQCNDPATKITFSSFASMDIKPDEYPVLDANNYKSYLSEILQSANFTSEQIQSLPIYNDDVNSTSYYRFHNNTNWQKEVFQNGYSQNYFLSINGGDNVAKYNVSMGYTNKKGIIRNSDFARFNTRFNADIYFSKKLLVNANLGFATISRNIYSDGVDETNPAYLSLIKEPFLTPYKRAITGETGSEVDDYYIFNNPTALTESRVPEDRNNIFFGSVKATYKLSSKVSFSSLVGINFNKIHDRFFIPNLGIKPEIANYVLIRKSENRVNTLQMLYNETKLTYSNINPIHNLTVNAGFRFQSNSLKDLYGIGYNSANDNSGSLGMSYKPYAIKGGSIGENNWASIFLVADYNFYKKYFLSATIETDGSSKFGKEANGLSMFSTKFAMFHSVGAAWLASSENFMANMSFVDLLKVRVSYGTTGNDALGNYWNQRIYGTSTYFRESVIMPMNILNPELQWETVQKVNFGLDLAMFNQRLTASVDIYNHKTKDMVMVKSVPAFTGFENYLVNGGSMKNAGYEVQLNAKILEGDLKWHLGASISKYKNEITALPDGDFITNIAGANILTSVGKPAGVFYGYESLGVFATDVEAATYTQNKANGTPVNFSGGDIHFASADNFIDENDMKVIGDPNPDFTGSINTLIQWKRISLDALVTYSVGNDVYNYLRSRLESMSGYENQTKAANNRWRFDGQITEMPKAIYGDPMGNSRFSSRWIEDGSYVRLKTITLAYDVPVKWAFVKNLNVYLTGNNILTLTKYKGFDPEFNLSSSPLEQGIDYGLVPQYKSMLFGVKLGL